MQQSSETDARPRMGYTKFGNGSMPAWKPAVAIGIPLTISVGALAAWLSPVSPLLAFAIFAAFLFSPVTMLGWASLVDRETIRGADRNPEESVESVWYSKSAQGVFHDALIACGLGAGLFAFFPLEVDLSWVLMGLTVLLMVDFGLRYLFNKRRG